MRARLLLPLLLSAAACSSSGSSSSSGSPLSAAKQENLKKAVAAFKEIPADMHGTLAAAALADVESERLPAPLVKTLESIAQVSPDMRSLMILEGLAESLAPLQVMCQGAGLEMMKAMAQQAPDTRLALIRERCKTDRFELVSHPGPNTDAIAYLLAHVVFSHLQENGGVSANEKILIEHLAASQTPANPY